MLLTQLETKLGLTKRIGLEVLIEEAEGLANAAEIARSSDRLEAHHLRRRRPVGLAARPGRRQLRSGRRLPRRLLALRPGPGAGRRPGRGHRRHRRAVPRLPGPRRLPRGRPRHAGLLGFDGKWAIHPEPDPHRQRGVLADRGRGRRRRATRSRCTGRSEADGVGAIGRDGQARRRRPHAPGRERAAQGGAGRAEHGRRPDDRGRDGRGRLRVVQWATGNIGTRSLRAVIEHPDLELAGVHVHSRRQGRAATPGSCAASAPTGVVATHDIDEILAVGARLRALHAAAAATSTSSAGCSRPAPTSSRPAASSTTRRAWTPPCASASRPPAREGGTSIHSTGSSPGFITEALPARADVDPAPARPAADRRVRRPVEPQLARAAVRPDGLRHGPRRLRPAAAGPTARPRFGPSLRLSPRRSACPSTRCESSGRGGRRHPRHRDRRGSRSPRAPSPRSG